MINDYKCGAVVVDDHPLARLAIKTLLEANNIEVLSEAEDGHVGLKIIDSLKPDIAIIDVDLPLRSGVEVVEMLRKKGAHCIIIVVSAKNDSFYGKRCADAGANAFVSKKKGMNNIISAIDAARNGYAYFPFSLSKLLGVQSSEEEKLETLSSQEVKVMRYLLSGMDSILISREMNISTKTVSTYKSRLMEKLGCSTILELYAFSHRNHLD